MFDDITPNAVMQIVLVAVGMMFVGAVGGMIGAMYVYQLFIKPVKRAVDAMKATMIASHRIRPTSSLPAGHPVARRVVIHEEEHRVTTSTRLEPLAQPSPQTQVHPHVQLQAHEQQPTIISSARKPEYHAPHPLVALTRHDDTDIRVRQPINSTVISGAPIVSPAPISPRPAIQPSHTLPPENRWR